MNTPVVLSPISGFPQLTLTTVTTPTAHGTASVNTASATITYTPNAGYTGPDSVTYSMVDANSHSANGTISLMVTASGSSGPPTSGNHAPTAVNDSITTHGVAYTFDPQNQ